MGNSSDSSSTGDLFDRKMIFILVETIFLFGRTCMDVFILTVSYRDYMKKKRLSTTEKILTLQGSIRIGLGYLDMIWSILDKFCLWIFQLGYISNALTLTFWYFASYNVWLTASLCSYYCVKIADFSHPFFIHLKRRLSGLELTWFVGSAILSLESSLPFAFIDLRIQDNRNVSNSFQNESVTDSSYPVTAPHAHALLEVGFLAAFIICATSAVLLLFSLWRHRQRMLGSWGGHRSPQTNAHSQALITILSLLVNNVLCFISIQLQLSRILGGYSISHFGPSVVLYSCFSVDALISVWGNKKFRNELHRSLYFFKCRQCVS